MFIGHFAAGMAGKKVEPSVSLGTLIFAAQFLDLLWPTLLLLDLEHVVIAPGVSAVTPLEFTHYPISHSLLIVLLWGLLFSGVYRLLTKNTRGALLVGALVVSHWLLDLIVHIPDLPLYPGDAPHWGLGLWNYPVVTLIVEGSIFAAGLMLYVRAKKSAGQLSCAPLPDVSTSFISRQTRTPFSNTGTRNRAMRLPGTSTMCSA